MSGPEITIDVITIRGIALENLDSAASKRNVKPKQVLADIIHTVLVENIIDAVLDDS